MPIPDRPVDDAIIETDWGQEIHDRVFAPKGCILTGTAVSLADNTFALIPLDNADTDPGGWHDSVNDRAEVPTDAEGLYDLSARFVSDDVDPTVTVRGYVFLNGSEIGRADVQGDDTVQINWPVTLIGQEFAAGDLITCGAKKIGTAGGSIDVFVSNITILRRGAEIGA